MAELPELTDLSDNASVASSMTMRASSAPIQDAHEYTKLFRTWEKVRECGQTNGSGARSEAREQRDIALRLIDERYPASSGIL